jgi:hypothetical protein
MEYERSAPPGFRARVYAAVFGFAAVNVLFIVAVGQSLVGPIPYGVFLLMLAACGLGMLLVVPFWAMTRGWGLTWADLAAWAGCLGVLAWLNYLCFASAVVAQT